MNRYRLQAAPAWWSPKLRPRMIRLLQGFRRRKQIRDEQLMEIDVRGADGVSQLLREGHGVMITPNHPTHADAYSIYAAADAIGTAFYLMTAWQVFDDKSWIGQQVLRWHGCFSVDRESTDLRAFRQAVEILESSPYPLVVFPEGEVYHSNARVRPFRDGAAVIALSACKRAKRPIVCVPCGMLYRYLDDPTQELTELMDELERRIFWRPQSQRPLAERVYRFADALLAIKELEFFGSAASGPLPERINQLAEHILAKVESRHSIAPSSGRLPERVKEIRRKILEVLEQDELDATERQKLLDELDDVFLVVQLFSYPGDYVAEQPTIERLAETLDKLEEDVLNQFSATVRGRRRAVVEFGQPVLVERKGKAKTLASEITETLETRVQALIEGLSA
jgi:1-acyl-sn-glycerol-3-phosphate acyltransferase